MFGPGEVKTVGSHEAAILSAKDNGSLDQWLRSHGKGVTKGQKKVFSNCAARVTHTPARRKGPDPPSLRKLWRTSGNRNGRLTRAGSFVPPFIHDGFRRAKIRLESLVKALLAHAIENLDSIAIIV